MLIYLKVNSDLWSAEMVHKAMTEDAAYNMVGQRTRHQEQMQQEELDDRSDSGEDGDSEMENEGIVVVESSSESGSYGQFTIILD